jgi:Icc-related predicted phosphoesterase
MKILAVGDFHGKFPKKINDLIKNEGIDVVLSNGDYFPFYYRKLWFKHCYGADVELWEVIGKKKYKELLRRDLVAGERALKKLNALPVPVFTTIGNLDYTKLNDSYDFGRVSKKEEGWDWADQDFFSLIVKKYKNIQRVDYKAARFGDYVVIGAYGGTNRGHVKSMAFRKHRKILDKLFKKYRSENKEGRVIFLTHNVPYDTKLDKASKDAHPKVAGKHIGSKLVRRVVQAHKPILTIGGHMHEGTGKDKIGKTLCVNPGAVHDNEASVITMVEGKKPKVKFYKF